VSMQPASPTCPDGVRPPWAIAIVTSLVAAASIAWLARPTDLQPSAHLTLPVNSRINPSTPALSP
jgi:hypothetical protein